jgi:hypothetical protein
MRIYRFRKKLLHFLGSLSKTHASIAIAVLDFSFQGR